MAKQLPQCTPTTLHSDSFPISVVFVRFLSKFVAAGTRKERTELADSRALW